MTKEKTGKNEPTVIKKYPNRRLYDKGRSSYITLDDLCKMVQEGRDFVVLDAKTGEDLTRGVLRQIIDDQETTEETLLPTNFLRTLIGFYGNDAQNMLPDYLEQTMALFAQNQEQLNETLKAIPGVNNIFPQAVNLEELTRKNMAMFERTMKMMSPFNAPETDATKTKCAAKRK